MGLMLRRWAVHYAIRFGPHLFTEVGQQPVQARAAVRRMPFPRRAECRYAGLPLSRRAERLPTFAFHPHLDNGIYDTLGARRPCEPLAKPAAGIGRVRALVLYKNPPLAH